MIHHKAVTGFVVLLVSISVQAAAPARFSALEARHFLLRTGFAPDETEVRALTGESSRQAVLEVVGKAQMARPLHAAPDFTLQSAPACRSLRSPQERQVWRQQRLREGSEIKTWWVR